jgi:hypothetical protein
MTHRPLKVIAIHFTAAPQQTPSRSEQLNRRLNIENRGVVRFTAEAQFSHIPIVSPNLEKASWHAITRHS